MTTKAVVTRQRQKQLMRTVAKMVTKTVAKTMPSTAVTMTMLSTAATTTMLSTAVTMMTMMETAATQWPFTMTDNDNNQPQQQHMTSN